MRQLVAAGVAGLFLLGPAHLVGAEDSVSPMVIHAHGHTGEAHCLKPVAHVEQPNPDGHHTHGHIPSSTAPGEECCDPPMWVGVSQVRASASVSVIATLPTGSTGQVRPTAANTATIAEPPPPMAQLYTRTCRLHRAPPSA